MPKIHEWINGKLADLAVLPTWIQVLSALGSILIIGWLAMDKVRVTLALPGELVEVRQELRAVREVASRADTAVTGLRSDFKEGQQRVERKIDQLLCFHEAGRNERSYESCLRNRN